MFRNLRFLMIDYTDQPSRCRIRYVRSRSTTIRVRNFGMNCVYGWCRLRSPTLRNANFRYIGRLRLSSIGAHGIEYGRPRGHHAGK
jgi:hypothetical protein